MTQKILEILIPTYRRPQAAIGAIDSVLRGASDGQIGVFCHSNGVELELEAAAVSSPVLRYGCFPENRGAVANFRKILEDSNAEYVLFLSDEDRIDSKQLAGFIEFLTNGQYSFVCCSIVETSGANYFSVAALKDETLSSEDLLSLFPIDPTYLSGYCFRRDLLTAELLKEVFEDHGANVYPHLLLRNAVARYGRIGIFAPGMILKGVEANSGGDSHAHLTSDQSNSLAQTRRQSLNPSIYGEGARALQFYYLVPRLDRDLKAVSGFKRACVKLYVLSAWMKITSDAYLYVDVAASVMSLASAINENRLGAGSNSGILIEAYNRIMSIRQAACRSILVNCLWQVAKAVKLILFVHRFGVARTWAFVKRKHGWHEDLT
jgi:hypothetical protein